MACTCVWIVPLASIVFFQMFPAFPNAGAFHADPLCHFAWSVAWLCPRQKLPTGEALVQQPSFRNLLTTDLAMAYGRPQNTITLS